MAQKSFWNWKYLLKVPGRSQTLSWYFRGLRFHGSLISTHHPPLTRFCPHCRLKSRISCWNNFLTLWETHVWFHHYTLCRSSSNQNQIRKVGHLHLRLMLKINKPFSTTTSTIKLRQQKKRQNII